MARRHARHARVRHESGEIVITGSALEARFPEAGDQITYRIEGLG